MNERHYTMLDQLIIGLDRGLASFKKPTPHFPQRPSPAQSVEDLALNEAERRLSEGLMRVNHAGEVSAQALYQGQAMASRNVTVCNTMQQSAEEEIDHLAWCEQRINELGGRTSYLNPLWYLGSFSLGTLAGIAGDKWSLGFVAETERQVVEHLQEHLKRLPSDDLKSRAIVQQMAEDEARHGSIAQETGGIELPTIIKTAMRFCSKLMTRTVYWI
jgi:ubiquinone biosynthesis monooxygenase Coq7